jgi:aldehyde:ferredoxin oxidoreductase
MDDDRLPEMFFAQGHQTLTWAVLDQMRLEFYAAMGWDATGRPLAATLERLAIGSAAAEPVNRPVSCR